jgi:hypothetical protein
MVSYAQFFVKFSQWRVVKLSPIIRDEIPWNSKSTYYCLPYESPYLLLSDCREWFGFHPHGEVVNPYHQKFQLLSSYWKRTHDIQSPLSERPGGRHWSEYFWWRMGEVSKPLAFITSSDVRDGGLLYCWSIVFCPNKFVT